MLAACAWTRFTGFGGSLCERCSDSPTIHAVPKWRWMLIKYGITYKGAFQAWMPALGYVDIRRLPKPAKALGAYTLSKPKEENIEALRRRIKDLERERDDEKLRAEAYARLIELAEREQGISIRKKDNTK